MKVNVFRLDVFPYWFSFIAAFIGFPFFVSNEWIRFNAVFGLLFGLFILFQCVAENTFASTPPFPRLVEWDGPALGVFLLNLLIGGIAGIVTGICLIFIWNSFGPEPDPISLEFGWREYIQWLVVVVPTFIVTLVFPLAGACFVARRPERENVG